MIIKEKIVNIMNNKTPSIFEFRAVFNTTHNQFFVRIIEVLLKKS